MGEPNKIKIEGEFYEYVLEVDGLKNTLSLDGGWWTLGCVSGDLAAPYQRFRAATRIKAITRALEFMNQAPKES